MNQPADKPPAIGPARAVPPTRGTPAPKPPKGLAAPAAPAALPSAAPLVCPRCRTNTVRPCMRPGRTMRYRNLAALALPAEMAIPTCRRCGTVSLDAQTRARLAPLLAETYQGILRQRVRRVIDTLAQHISQKRLEQLIGLSQGYLSRLRSGTGTPSPELVSHLALLARDAKARLLELERYWAEPSLPNGLPAAPDGPPSSPTSKESPCV